MLILIYFTGMVRKYLRGIGKRNYKAFNDADMERAISAVKDGMSKAKASHNFGVPRSTLQNRLGMRHTATVGRPTVLSDEEEKVLIATLSEVAEWGYPLMPLTSK